MSYTQTQLDVLDAAMASGALRVTYDGKTTEYRSIDELVRARAIVQKALQPTLGRATQANPTYSRGT